MRKVLLVLLAAFSLQITAQKVDATLLKIVRENARTVKNVKVKRAGTPKYEREPIKITDIKTGETTVLDFKHEVNGVDTMRLKQSYELSFNGDGSIRSCTVIGTLCDGAAVPMERLRALGVSVDDVVGQSVIMTVPANKLEQLEAFIEFSAIKASHINRLNNENSRKVTSANYVTGESSTEYGGIATQYDGTGVVLGVIDTGIDFNHAAFLNPETGDTRVKIAGYFAKENDADVMKQVTEPDEISLLTTADTRNSHGTHTSCTAGGSNVGGLGLQGMAPKADLVLFDLGNNLSDSRILRATNAIFEYAESVNKPAVINMSFGNNFGFHDGNGLEKEIAALTGKGRVVCVSAGNEAECRMSIRKKLGAADADGYNLRFVLCSDKRNEQGQVVYPKGMDLFFYADDSRPFTVECKAVDVTTGEVFGIAEIMKNDAGEPVMNSEPSASSVNAGNGRSYDGTWRYNKMCVLDSENHNLAVALFVKGAEEQTISVIDRNAISGEDYMAGENEFPTLKGYTDGDDQLSINRFACNDQMISVGSFVQSRTFHDSVLNRNWGSNVANGQIAPYSSYGIDDNGKSRPDVLAPGMWTLSAYNIYDESYFTNMVLKEDADPGAVTNIINDLNIVGYDARPYPFGSMTGTSMACPVATGIVALWLQADPTLTPEGIKALLQQTTLNDKWTAETDYAPSSHLTQAGLGKIDALRGIKAIENAKGEILYPLNETITVANGITTFSSMQPLDFSASTAPKAYVATDYTDGVLNFLRVEQCIPSQTGLLLVGEDGEYTVPIVPTTKVGGSNLLESTASASVTLSQEGEAYVLSKQNGVVGFYQNAANLTVPQGKAYLKLPAETPTQAKAIGYVFSEDNSTTTDGEYEEIGFKGLWHPVVVSDAIDNVTIDATPSQFHNLQGQRVGNDYRGIIIINGKKYIQR